MNSPTLSVQALVQLERDFDRIQQSITVTNDLRQVRAFAMIAKHSIEGDPLTAQDLCHYLGFASQTAHNMVKHFVAEGLLTQQRDDHDARAKHLMLTDEGTAALRRLIGV